jgi:flagellar hook protein FlgE
MIRFARFYASKCGFSALFARGRQLLFIFGLVLMGNAVAAQTAEPVVITNLPSTDLAIAGPGYFIVRDPDALLLYITRYGQFTIDPDGYLITSDGFRVQGYDDTTVTNFGDVRIDNLGAPGGDTAPVQNFQINTDGTVVITLNDNNSYVGCQILLQNVSHPQGLQKAGQYLYKLDPATGILPMAQPPGTDGLGLLEMGSEELPVTTLTINRLHGPPSPLAHGLLHPTGVPTDFGIEGNGFFRLRDPNTGALFASRAGAFQQDTNGYLVNYSGLRVQGYSDTNLSVLGDVRMTLSPRNITFDHVTRSGQIYQTTIDGTTTVVGEILLWDCLQPAQLSVTNFSLFPVNTNLAMWTAATVPEQNGLGWIAPGMIETSQFDNSILAVRRTLNFFTQGPIVSTGEPLDLSVNSRGFFIVRNPTNNTFAATRGGHFQLGAAGHLVDTNGGWLQGLTDPALTVPGDIVVDAAQKPAGADPTAMLQSCTCGPDGLLIVNLTDGTTYIRGQVTLQYFTDLQALESADGIFFTNLAAALPMFTNAGPTRMGLGSIVTGSLEMIPPVRMPELALLPQTGFRVQINNLPDASQNNLESSSDLVHWTTLTGLSMNDIGASEFYDTNAPAASGVFYRTQAVVHYPTNSLGGAIPLN